MASGACARGNTGVIKHSVGEGRETRVAAVARGRGGKVICRFTLRIPGRVCPAVASRARALSRQDALRGGVRECRSRECTRVMASIARGVCRNMVRRLGHAGAALDVTGGATSGGHAGMIKPGAGEGRVTRCVTRVARGRSGHVAGRFAERVPLSVGTIVAGAALTGYHTLRSGVRESRGRE
jgi:hypothetical protein